LVERVSKAAPGARRAALIPTLLRKDRRPRYLGDRSVVAVCDGSFE
jgi:hypothetical protein